MIGNYFFFKIHPQSTSKSSPNYVSYNGNKNSNLSQQSGSRQDSDHDRKKKLLTDSSISTSSAQNTSTSSTIDCTLREHRINRLNASSSKIIPYARLNPDYTASNAYEHQNSTLNIFQV